MNKQYEYHQFIERVLETDDFNTLEYLNQKGAEGWILLNQQHGTEESGISAISGQKILRHVMAFFMYREKPENVGEVIEGEVVASVVVEAGDSSTELPPASETKSGLMAA